MRERKAYWRPARWYDEKEDSLVKTGSSGGKLGCRFNDEEDDLVKTGASGGKIGRGI